MVGAEEGLRRPRPQRGRPGRTGPAQARGPGEEGRTRGAGSGRDWAADVLAGSAAHLPGAGARAGEESPQRGRGAGVDPRTGPSLPASHRKPLRDWWCREPKNYSGTHVTRPGDLGVGEPCRVRPRRLLHPRNPRIAAATLSWGRGGVCALVTPSAGGSGLGAGHPQMEADCVVSGS